MVPTRNLGRIALALALLAAAAWSLSHPAALAPAAIESWVRDAGPWLPIVFVLLHIPASLLFLPRMVMGITAGVLFGVWWGSLLAITGATLGATIGFCAARYISADWLAGTSVPRLQAFLARAEEQGFRLVLMLRLTPVLPHAGVNYGLGLTSVPLSQYVAASFLGMLPTAVIYVYLGYAGGLAVDGGDDWVRPVIWALGLLAASFLLPKLLSRQPKPPP